MLCPSCGEDNPQAYHFCGMCGTLLRAKPAAITADFPGTRKPAPVASPEAAKERRPPAETVPPIPEPRPRPQEPAAGISGPSLLGLDETYPAGPSDDERFEPFRRSGAVFEPDEHVTRRRLLALVALLLALGAVARWTYWNYVRASGSPTSATASDQPGFGPSATTTSPQPATAAAPANPQPQAATQATQPAPAAPAKTQPAPAKSAGASAKGSETIAIEESPSASTQPATAQRTKATPAAVSAAASSVAATNTHGPEASGDADYRKGESFLYGHGASADCEQAVKFLKTASTKGSAKARSTFGTLYATGHCVPRDLPTSYGWFALALQADPNNQILEQDLNAIWNQMTPPERELATKMKP